MNTIAFLTTDLLGERSYSINYHLLFFSRCLLENYKDVRIIVFTSEINSKNQNSLTQILIQNDIDVPTERIEVCTCNYRDYLIIGDRKLLAVEVHLFHLRQSCPGLENGFLTVTSPSPCSSGMWNN